MATTYTSDKVGPGVPVRRPVSGPTVVMAKYSITAALVVNDVIQMIPVHAGEIVYDLWVVMPDVDTDGTPAATFIVGDDGNDDRYITQTAAGVAATFTRMNAVTAAVSTSPYTTDNTIDIKFDTAPDASVTTGDIFLCAILGQER